VHDGQLKANLRGKKKVLSGLKSLLDEVDVDVTSGLQDW